MNPIVNEVKKSYNQRINFVYVELSGADGKELAREEGVMGTPTFLFLDGDGKRVYLLQGVQQHSFLEQRLDDLLASE
ncbi:MAG: thioredoxin family protein [Anaerolineae bacterium]